MAVPLLEMEGTWAEIVGRAPEFGDLRLRVVASPAEGGEPTDADPLSGEACLAVLRQIEVRSSAMNPEPDTRDYLREGRTGGMA